MNEDESASEAERLAAKDESEDESDYEKKSKVSFQKQDIVKQVTSEAVVEDTSFTLVGKGGKPVEITKDSILKILSDLLEERGKKGSDKVSLAENMAKLLSKCTTPYQSLKVLLSLIPARFDCASPSSGYTPTDIWKLALKENNQLLDILESYPKVTVGMSEIIHDETDANKEQVIFQVFSKFNYKNTKLNDE
jgi:translation initiation factor 3 subunit C